MSRSLSAIGLALAVASGLAFFPSAAQAQKGLVYCPAPIDATGCGPIVTALTTDPSPFPDGVETAYDGSSGTVDLATADLSAYAVLVVPSLADGAGTEPYGLLRDQQIVGRLSSAFNGRNAVWSGTPDHGSTNRAAKDALLRNLAGWARGDATAGRGPGIVVLQDNSDDAAARYSWLRGISGLSVVADTTFEVYSNVQVLTSTGRQLLTNSSGLQIGFTNMAAYGLIASGSGVSNDATGGRSARVVLATTSGETGTAGTGIATIATDKEDYQPGDSVTVTGTGWDPGETVSLLFHEDVDPPVHPDKTYTTVADADGHVVNRDYEIDELDLNVRFTLQATGLTSGKTAQTTFTDATDSRTVQAQTAFSPVTSTVTSAILYTSGDCTTGGAAITGAPFTIASAAPTTIANATNTAGKSVKLTARSTATNPATGGFLNWSTTNNSNFTPVAGDPLSICVPGTNGNQTGIFVANYLTTSTSVVSSLNPSLFGQSVTFTATVTSLIGGTVNAGTVTFKDGATTLSTTNVNSSGVATSTAVSTLTVGSHSITATYNGSGNFTTSTSAVLTQTVNPVSDLTIAKSHSGSFVVGTPASYTLTVTNSGSASTSGVVTVTDVQPTGLSFTGASGTGWTCGGTTTITCTRSDALAAAASYPNITLNVTPTAAGGVTNTASVAGGGEFNTGNNSASDPTTVLAAVDLTINKSHSGNLTVGVNGTYTLTVSNGGAVATSGTVTVTDLLPTGLGFVSADGGVTWSCGFASGTVTCTRTTAITAGGNAPTITLVVSVAAGAVPSVTNTASVGGGGEPTANNGNNGDNDLTTVNPAPNNAPVAIDDNYQVLEDHTLTVAAPGVLTNDTDADGDPLTASQQGNAGSGTGTIASDGGFTYTPNANFFGSDKVNYKANDGQVNSNTAMAFVTVLPVNDAPSFTKGANESVTEGSGAHTVSPWATAISAGPANESGQTLTFNVTANSNTALFAVQPAVSSTGALTYTLAASGVGVATITLELKDNGGTTNGGVDTSPSQTFTITVNGVPDLTIDKSHTGDFTEGTNGSYSLVVSNSGNGATSGIYTVTDVMPTGLTYVSGSGSGWSCNSAPATTMTCNRSTSLTTSGTGSTATITLTVTPTAAGSVTNTATVNGGGQVNTANDSDDDPTTVNASNHAPTLANVPATATIDELAPYTFTATATDPESPPQTLTFSLVSGPTGASIGASTGIFSWTPTESQGPGSYPFKVRVSDNATPVLFNEKDITLTVNEVNAAPVLGDIADKTVRWGHTLSFTASATDDDVPPQGLSFSFEPGAPAAATINASGVFSWTPTASDVGDHPITVNVSDGVTSDSKSFTVTVQKHPTAVVYDGATSAPYKGSPAFRATLTDADADPGTPLSGKSIRFTLGSQHVDATTMSAGAAGVASASLTLDASQHAGPYTVESSFTGDGAYESSGDSDPFTINKAHATLTIDPTKLSFIYDGSSKSATVATDPTGLAGVLVTYDGSATAPTDAGSYAVVAKLDNTDYEADDANATLDIAKATQLITFPAIAGKTFGDASFAAGATINSTLAIEYSASGKCTVASNGTVSITGAGNCTITAKQPGDKNHFAADDKAQSFAIEKATPTITWSNPAPIVYGTSLSSTQLNATVSGVGGASVAGAFGYTPASGEYLNAGTQTLSTTFTPSGGDADNYKSADKSVSLTVNKAELTVTANDKTKVYGEPVPSLDGEITGFVLGQNSSVLTSQPTFTTTATPTSGVPGPYAINGSGAAAANYDFKYVAGKLAVTKATPAFSNLASPTITYGAASTTFSGVIGTAFVHPGGDVSITVNGATVLASINTVDGTFSASVATGLFNVPATPYTVTYSFAGAEPNFNAAVNGIGTLTVNKATPTINWNNPAQMVFGQALSGTQLNATVSGVGGSVVAGLLAYSPPLGTVLPVGLQALSVLFTPTGTDANNYKTATKGVQVAVLYNTAVGHQFLQPVNIPPLQRSAFKIGSTIPVKFQLFMADGVTPVTNAVATIQLTKLTSGTPDAVNEQVYTNVPDQGINFRYTGGQYIFNLGTKLVLQTTGTYRLTAFLNDGSTIIQDIEMKSN